LLGLTITHIIVLLVTGAVTGFTSSILGLGGAFIMTPVQYAIFSNMGIPTDTAIKLAFGTNMLVVLTTALSGTWRYQLQRVVLWKASAIMGGCSLAGSLIGATVATYLPGQALKIIFGILVIAVGIRILTAKQPEIQSVSKTDKWLWVVWALPMGIAAGLLGMGGGIFAIPVLTIVLRFKMHEAVIISLAMMIFTGFGGVIGYIVNGINAPNLPAYCLGYIYIPSWLILASTSVFTAQVGAMFAYRIPTKHLTRVFILITFYLGLKMVGLFEWLGWPI